MPDKTLIIRPCTPTDIPTLAAINHLCFNGPGNKLIYRNVSPSDRTKQLESRARAVLEHSSTSSPHNIGPSQSQSQSQIHYLCVVDTTTDKVISHAIWIWLPAGYIASEDLDTQRPWLPPGTNEVLVKNCDRMTQTLRSAYPGRLQPHWLLSLLATKPEHEGRGAGSMLVGWGTERADAMGVRCFVDASVRGEGLYRRRGFMEEVGTLELDLRGYEGGEGYGVQRWVALMREPRGKGKWEEVGEDGANGESR
ncbi:MAG: hypothetical protein Q9166_007716 [cf. Caloplaca sp. 2 TL-2023]